jgi:hypothetical protein
VDDKWQEIQCETCLVCLDSWVVFLAGHSQETSLWKSDDAKEDDSDVHPEQRSPDSQGGWVASSLFDFAQDDEEDLSAKDWLFKGYSGI